MLLLQPLMLARGETALQAPPTVPRPRPGPVRSLRVPPVGAKERNRSSEKTRSDVPFFPFSQPLRPSLPLPHQKKQNRLRRVRTFRPRPSLAALQAEGPQEEDADPRAGNWGAEARLQPAAASAASAAIPPGERRWWRRRPRPRPRWARRRRQGPRWRRGRGSGGRREMAAGGRRGCGAGRGGRPGRGRACDLHGREPEARRGRKGRERSCRGSRDPRCCCCCCCSNSDEARLPAGSDGCRRQRRRRERGGSSRSSRRRRNSSS